MNNSKDVIREVAEIYSSLDEEIAKHKESALCSACGKCCDFQSFGHRLYVTSPELIYFTNKINFHSDGLAPRPAWGDLVEGRCPCQSGNKCSVYPHRFASCRIFSCKGDPDFQSRLTESALKKFKSICEKYQIPYQYSEFPSALNDFIK